MYVLILILMFAFVAVDMDVFFPPGTPLVSLTEIKVGADWYFGDLNRIRSQAVDYKTKIFNTVN